MITKFENFLNETNITDVVFHRTSIQALYNILKGGKILMSSSMGGNADVYSRKPYFLSLSRTKHLKQGYSKNSNVTIELDGRQLKTKFKGKSIDYWQWDYKDKEAGAGARSRFESDEFEDRIFSNEPYLSNLDKYVKHFDIMIPKNEDNWNQSWINSLKEYIDHIKKLNSPLLNKVRVFQSESDFNIGRNWISLKDYSPKYDPSENWSPSDYSNDFDFRLFMRVVTILLIGNKGDDNFLRKEIRKYIDKMIGLGVEKLKRVTEEDINEVIRKVKWLAQWGYDDDYIYSTISDIHNITKSSRKSEINYEILRLLSDEMVKYNVVNIQGLINAKRGITKTPEKLIDYSKYWLIVNNKRYGAQNFEVKVERGFKGSSFYWTKLSEKNRKLMWDTVQKSGGGYEVSDKDIINTIFNNYDEKKAKEILSSILEEDLILVNTQNKLIYKEITEVDYFGDDIGHRGCWMYVDKNKWNIFIKDNISEQKYKQVNSQLERIMNDDEIKIRFVWAITEKLVGEEKTLKFFEENNLTPIVEERTHNYMRYLINIGKEGKDYIVSTLKKEEEYVT